MFQIHFIDLHDINALDLKQLLYILSTGEIISFDDYSMEQYCCRVHVKGTNEESMRPVVNFPWLTQSFNFKFSCMLFCFVIFVWAFGP